MEVTALIVLTAFTLCYCMVAKRLAPTIITAPMLFLGLGFLFAETGLVSGEETGEILHLVAEIALVILLFLDAAQINGAELRRKHIWPLRMLVIGLPLTIVFGALVAMPLLPGWNLMAVFLLAAVLSPTDAALGRAVVANPQVPERMRRALSVESGLNDGLALPAILLFASLTAETTGQTGFDWLAFVGKQLVFGPLAGILVGYAGGQILLWAKDRDFTSDTFEGIGAISLAGLAYLLAIMVDGNGFIAAFVAGLAFGYVVKDRCKFIFEFTESEGQMLSWGAFLLIGISLMPEAIRNLDWAVIGIIALVFFVVRPLAVWLSLIGTDAPPLARLFFGWFGPHGLATALFALLVVPQIDEAYAGPVLDIAVNAVWISALLHGITAAPAARWYAERLQRNR